jgi:hypothetical protein
LMPSWSQSNTKVVFKALSTLPPGSSNFSHLNRIIVTVSVTVKD